MKKLLFLCALGIGGLSGVSDASALTVSSSLGSLRNYCGAYASTIKNGTTYQVFSNAIPNTKALCPGSGCPGIVKYSGSSLTRLGFNGVVAANGIIDDVFNADGTLSPDRMFSRPVIVKDGDGYAAVAMVLNGYPAVDGQGVPAFLTSPDGVNWTYHGKFKGEPWGRSVFGSGMALIADPSASPHYRFYTDGYGVGMAGLVSDGNNQWTFIKNATNGIAELKPPQWTGVTFHSLAKFNGMYYMAASDGWPVRGWQFAHSLDGVNWTHDLHMIVGSYQKNISLYIDGTHLKGLGTSGFTNTCYKKDIREIYVP